MEVLKIVMASPCQPKATHFSCQLWKMEATKIHECEMRSLRNQTDKTQARLKTTLDGKVNKTRKNVNYGMRNWLSIERKFEIIEAYENGANFEKLSCDFGMHELTIRAIIRRKEEIKVSVRKDNETHVDNIHKSKLADEMEKLLISNKSK